jgi:putative SOS response-associated peptidase YedK
VLADGFYEWRKEGDAKTPYFISLADGSPFAFAGLWENWSSKESEESLQTAAIITTAASDFMATLHQRMPVVMLPAQADRWLGGDMELLSEVIDEPPAFRAWPVDHKVNNARNEGAQLIDPAGATLS